MPAIVYVPHPQATPLLGVFVARTLPGAEPPFASAGFYRQLSRFGRREGLEVFVFAADGIDWQRREASGYTYDETEGRWRERRGPLPTVVYDRSFPATRAGWTRCREQLRQLVRTPGVQALGCGLPGKWEVQAMLERDASLRPFLPPTRRLTGPRPLRALLAEEGSAFLKPQGASHGKGALYVRRAAPGPNAASAKEGGGAGQLHEPDAAAAKGGWLVLGRAFDNAPLALQFAGFGELWQWLSGFARGRSYLVQRYLSLHTADGVAFDVRALVQKDGRGRWQTTGTAVRCGQPGSVTSNLHGGGAAADAATFLRRACGEAQADAALRTIAELAARIPPALEAAHGRLAELGLDFGVDREGRVWLLEANSKPGRAAFKQLADREVRARTLANPVRYARFLLQQSAATGPLKPAGQQV
ncbi:YheC/YheD family protein [Paenibacillus athensensis]|uniref:YheC/YheD family protein n=1 Tax=Paenibacillus athensensis TaxID=1967502 RepID=A0A4Y8PW74_9BACL|nr:YheC/YheD family protein [Paenibacillus athensensis]MCD1258864.1 YheC/YheD family protein [Paenibacillus athensensis]